MQYHENKVRDIKITYIGGGSQGWARSLMKDKQLAFNAFINDPLVATPREKAELLFEEMLQNTKSYLLEWKTKDHKDSVVHNTN